MDWVEVEGASMEEAEAKALETLGVSDKSGVEFEEVKVVRRFLGMGGKSVKLRARLKEAAPEVVEEEQAVEVEEIIEAPEVEEKEEVPARAETPPDEMVTMESRYRPWVTEGPGGVVVPRKKRSYGGRLYNSEPFAEEEEAPAAPAALVEEREEEVQYEEEEFVPSVYEDVEDSPISEETRQKAVDFIKRLLGDMGFEGDAKGFKLADRLLVQIHTDSGGLLIGRKGETLDSLQYLLDIIINRKLEHRVRIVLDTEHYRERRKFAVFQKARHAAEDAVRTRKAVSLAPMNPSERRMVHLALSEDKRVETESEGEGLRRRVVVYPVGASKEKKFKKGGKSFHHGRPRRRKR